MEDANKYLSIYPHPQSHLHPPTHLRSTAADGKTSVQPPLPSPSSPLLLPLPLPSLHLPLPLTPPVLAVGWCWPSRAPPQRDGKDGRHHQMGRMPPPDGIRSLDASLSLLSRLGRCLTPPTSLRRLAHALAMPQALR